MTDLEFLVLDELYFVISFNELMQATDLEPGVLISTLESLAQKGFVKILFPGPDSEIPFQAATFGMQAVQCYFLASKAGLLAHTSI